LGNDLGRIFLHAVPVSPLARLQQPFDAHRFNLLQVLARNLGHKVIEDKTVQFGLFLALAADLVFPASTGGNDDVANRRPAVRIANFRVAAEIADEDELIDCGHRFVPLVEKRAQLIPPTGDVTG